MISLRIAEIISPPKKWDRKSQIRKMQKGLGPQIVICGRSATPKNFESPDMRFGELFFGSPTSEWLTCRIWAVALPTYLQLQYSIQQILKVRNAILRFGELFFGSPTSEWLTCYRIWAVAMPTYLHLQYPRIGSNYNEDITYRRASPQLSD